MMGHAKTLRGAAALLPALLLAACAAGGDARETPTADHQRLSIEQISQGIESHIAEEAEANDGRFRVEHDGGVLDMQLVRIHTEYLAYLGDGVSFACVDLADTNGDVYDVDFFMTGGPGEMRVTETTVHKKNGRPYYAWRQREDDTWHRVEMEAASPRDLGVLTGRDEFTFTYRARIPELTEPARMWLPMPESDRFQTVEIVSLETPGERRVLRDREYDNRILFLELDPEDGGSVVEMVLHVVRLEKSAYSAEGDEPPAPGPIRDERVAQMAREALEGKTGDLERARALYDRTLDHMQYIKFGVGYGNADPSYACDTGTGNCTEYHSLFMEMCREAGIPSRFQIGVSIPSTRNSGGIGGYHCWAEFMVDGKWWPVDVSEADKYSPLSTYYFGHHPANRLLLSRGLNLQVEPGPASGPINFLAYPVLEIGGRQVKADVEFSFTRSGP